MLMRGVRCWRRPTPGSSPRFALTGRDVMLAGVPEGPLVGQVLGEVEKWWIDNDFTDDEFSLVERLKAAVRAVGR